jgi:hypothetical protein
VSTMASEAEERSHDRGRYGKVVSHTIRIFWGANYGLW